MRLGIKHQHGRITKPGSVWQKLSSVYKCFDSTFSVRQDKLPCSSVHNVKLLDSIHLALATQHSHDVGITALAYQDPTSLFGYSDDLIPVVVMQLLLRVQESVTEQTEV